MPNFLVPIADDGPVTGPVAAIDDALTADAEATRREEAEVTKRLKQIEDARSFDAEARRQYAKDRKYARGDAKSWEVSTNLIGSNCDTLTAELYAKDPDVDVVLAEQVDAPRETPPMPPPPPPPQPMGVPMDPAHVAAYAKLNADYQQSLIAFHQVQLQRRKDADSRKAYARTLSICISRTWHDAKMKRKAKQMVRSGLTIGVGWQKLTWQERTGWDPATETAINDSKSQLDRLRALKAQMDENAPDDAQMAEYERAHEALAATPKKTIARGLAIDFVRGDDIQVSTQCANLLDYCDAPDISHRVFMSKNDAVAKYPRLGEKVMGQRLIDSATTYEQKKPLDLDTQEVGEVAKGVEPESADAYRSQTVSGNGANVCIWEMWDRDSGQVLTMCEGVKRWACDPVTPEPMTERFYPFFAFAPIEVEGERHPQSKVFRSYKLQDEYNRSRSAKTRLRRRAVPGVIFNRQQLTPEDAKSVSNSDVAENIGIDPVDPAADIRTMFTPKPVPAVDNNLYDTSEIRADMESVWGLQDALTGRVQVAKTATEAEIQQNGTNTRSGADRDALEDVLTDMSQATAEILVARFTLADAQKYAGEYAFWPEGEDAQHTFPLVRVSIRAGSSGKPDTTRQQQQWGALLPVLQAAVPQIATLRGAGKEEIADSLEALVVKSMEVAGSTDDPETYIPQGNATQQQPANTAPPGMSGVTMAGAPPLPPGIQQAVAALQPQGVASPPMADVPPANVMPQEATNVG